jgi:hypothetical protein
MVVVMVPMWMMQATVNDIVGVVPMRNSEVTTSPTMLVRRVARLTCRYRRTARRVDVADRYAVFFHRAILAHVVHVTMLQAIDMVAMLDPSGGWIVR